MPKEFNPQRLDLEAFAEEGAELTGSLMVGQRERLAAETEGRGLDRPVSWRARGELRNSQHVNPQVWLHLEASTPLSLTCQRCLSPVDTPVAVDRWFRFVADESTAQAEDDQSEEDVLVLSPAFDLLALIEDELLMASPLVPRHEVCPVPLPFGAATEEAGVPARSNPFAILGKLKGPGTH
ncbi:DUF177 domain-containing protein [Ramlibacter sp. AW1]|uniref:Large ribosomal RNA subunit accumulation protein YceD n=1 Tax=Ramlibacter aurantiacus TaxID=2801330 RepID=A0A936ZLJ8_9BURK|nr:DUF177 domain-containing protein [Ramlibacter aurantiacus]MBL0423117.1 DUF177 domain-containing protein [Ramlibacter aurantiacus]